MDLLALDDPGLRTPLPFRRLYESGAMLQRDFVRPSGSNGLEAAVKQRGLGSRSGREVWEHLVDMIAAYATSSVLIVDSEGDMRICRPR